ncbi:hypothetical protein [Rhodococcus globerulus]|uniref:Uncharacterized protein n=1 Tax=Rhodococcus globerulus TaxID=33008 RepID=A0ABU4C2E8_RHOGO|nr:hypothetical protein [Rhodococcus globerulus]MDV6270673.1 hypothetical protein [Rhodococcus globerulus]
METVRTMTGIHADYQSDAVLLSWRDSAAEVHIFISSRDSLAFLRAGLSTD